MSDDEYEIPLRDQRFFGSGLKRKRIQFVSSTAQTAASIPSSRSDAEVTAAEKYLSIVLGKRASSSPVSTSTRSSQESLSESTVRSNDDEAPLTTGSDDPERSRQPRLCEICSKPIDAGSRSLASRHDHSLVHQICMKHSHPPSHIDRERKGLAVLQSYGWDPDERKGLGAGGEGILQPIKARENAARAGLGAKLEEIKVVPKPVKLDAGRVRKSERDAQRHKDKLRRAFYQSNDVERYLGSADTDTLAT